MTRRAKDKGSWVHATTRWGIYLRDRKSGAHWPSCVYCEITLEELLEIHGTNFLTLDHVVPRSAGGSSGPENLLTVCWNCNDAKGRLTLKQYAEKYRLSYDKLHGRWRRRRRRDIEHYRLGAKMLLGLTDFYPELHPMVVSHDMLALQHWEGELGASAEYFYYLDRDELEAQKQAEMFCSGCNRPLEKQYAEDEIPF